MNGETTFEAYLEHLCETLGHSDRESGLKGYCQGLILPIGRKSVEPLAAHLEPENVSARHQSLHHFVSKSEWSDTALLDQVRRWVLPQMDPRDGVYWFVDNPEFCKKGTHSVGVARQYCSEPGKRENCQVAVSLSVATEHASLPVAYRLYLPHEWSDDLARRRKAGVPKEIEFATKPEIAATQLREARQSGAPDGIVIADAGYGDELAFRQAVCELGLPYAMGIRSSAHVCAQREPCADKRGRWSSFSPHAPEHEPISVKNIALSLDASRYRTVAWREGGGVALSSRFAAVRVTASLAHYWRPALCNEEWLLIEWPEGDAEPLNYSLSTLPQDATLERLVYVAKMRWRVERDSRDLKQQFGLGHFEGRGWRGFHHHASLCIATYGFFVAQRLIQGDGAKTAMGRNTFRLPESYVPRGSPALATPRS